MFLCNSNIVPHIRKEWEIPVRLAVNQSSSIINHEIIYQLQFTSNNPKNTCSCHNLSSADSVSRLQARHWSNNEPSSSYCLGATIVHNIHVLVLNFEILKFKGTQHWLECTPHPPTIKASTPDRSLEGYRLKREAALKFTGFRGSWGSEVSRLALSPHLPGELNPLLDSLTPLIACLLREYGVRPIDE